MKLPQETFSGAIMSGRRWMTFMATFVYWLIASESRSSAESAASSCPQGDLPHLDRAGFENWWGRDHVPIGDGQVHTYCFTVDIDTHRFELAVGDRTGAVQCSLARRPVHPTYRERLVSTT